MQIKSLRPRPTRHLIASWILGIVTFSSFSANAAEGTRGIEQALTTAQQDKRGITVYVAGQTIGGAVTRIEPGQWVEMKNQSSGKIIVRLDRIDAIAAP